MHHINKQGRNKNRLQAKYGGKNNEIMSKKDLINFNMLTEQEQKELARKGGKASVEARRRKKTLAEYFQAWADSNLTDENKQALKRAGIDVKDATNKSMMVLPLIKNISKGDVKSIQLAIELLGEDKKKDLEIKKLREENKLLKLQQEKLKEATGENLNLEDLTPLSEMLGFKMPTETPKQESVDKDDNL